MRAGRGIVGVEDNSSSTGLRIVRIQKEFAVVVHNADLEQFKPTMAAKHITRERVRSGKIDHRVKVVIEQGKRL